MQSAFANLLPGLPTAQRMAIAYTPSGCRMQTAVLLALDSQLAAFMASSGEPLLKQMRLAWWRDSLEQSPKQRPRGNTLLDCIGQCWPGEEGALVSLVNGWEMLLAEWNGGREAMPAFGDGRVHAFCGLGRLLGVRESDEDIALAARRWSYFDLVEHLSDEGERADALVAASALPQIPITLPRALRSLAILDGLARRALRLGNIRLIGDRFSPLAAMRLGILGR